jgi:hypothetical protein
MRAEPLAFHTRIAEIGSRGFWPWHKTRKTAKIFDLALSGLKLSVFAFACGKRKGS